MKESTTSKSSQRLAIERYRDRLSKRGIVRFEIQALDSDRELIRSLARRLTEGGVETAQIRATVRKSLDGGQTKKGGILEALRNSPLVGADLDLTRPIETNRKIDL